MIDCHKLIINNSIRTVVTSLKIALCLKVDGSSNRVYESDPCYVSVVSLPLWF